MASVRRTPDLTVLQLLVGVAEHGSLGRSAAVLGITQPAASQRLRSLERQLGLQLLVRARTGSRLTPAGETVVSCAQRVLAAADELLTVADALRAAQVGRVHVAASLTIADELFPRWLTTLHQQQPEATVSLHVANSERVAEMVTRGEVALGFVEGPSAPPSLRSRKVGGDELVVVVDPAHPWARRRRPVTAADLAAAPLALREPGSGTREALEHALGRLGLSVNARFELGASAALKNAAIAGDGPTVLSRLAVATEVGDGRLITVEIADVDFRRTFRAVWPPRCPPTGTAAALLGVATRAQPSSNPAST